MGRKNAHFLGVHCFVFSFCAIVMAAGAVRLEAVTTPNRGMWFWQNSTHLWGSTQVVGNAAKEDEVIRDLINAGVTRLYGGYGDRPISEPAVIATWNAKLHAAGIQSQVVFSETNVLSTASWTVETERYKLLAKIQARFLDFNQSRSLVSERFEAVHLDLEPQSFDDWGSMTPADKKECLYRLRDTYVAVREYLNSNGGAGASLIADLAFWFDKVPALDPLAKIGWDSEAERDQWFSDIRASLSSICLMAYELESISSFTSTTSYERVFFPQGYMALNVYDVFTGFWTDLHELMDKLLEIESSLASPTAIHSFNIYKDALATTSNMSPYLYPIGDKTVNEGQNLEFLMTAIDANNDPLTYSVSGLPVGAVFDSAAGKFSWRPGYEQAGSYSVTFAVTDGFDSIGQTIVITVTDVPVPDLIMTAVSGPVSGKKGTKITITSTVKNQGTAVCSSFDVGLYLSKDKMITTGDIKIGSYSVVTLGIGVSSLPRKSTVTLAASLIKGNYYLGAIADATNLRLESNETNNALAGNAFTVQ